MMTIIALLFLLIPVNNAWAIHAATKPEIRAIQKQIDDAQKGIPGEIDKYNAEISASDRGEIRLTDAQVMKIDEHIAHLRKQIPAAYNKAIKMTIKAYGLEPPKTSAKIITPNKFENLTAKFQVDYKAGRHDIYDQEQQREDHQSSNAGG
ncbi:MAG TPA: hypothetical protein VNH15_05960 [Elusimicrobiota bacterium]|nr:hypothetical protein [Elusimicrobiota bacterium]